ncbi:carboxylesterase/lipase family protein [Actinomyces israelii]|uniref:carboxylesterase/lipase family protein n=1 Tax=Actinomyces israelii TaxID=1659 RepID=UPI002555E8CE|nr:carboxylesterase family protein [Actinomyces israelii]WKR22638.1 Para-nitrobenzyl esterase [Actinomyces israelii]
MYNSAVVTTVHGPVRGRVAGGVASFKGIRYGADTAGYRFCPPRPPAPWTEPAGAFEFGPTAPQDHPDTGTDRAADPFLQMIGLTDSLPESEDCLFVNVWTPGTAARARDAGRLAPARPVLVWVHSGGYSDNSGSSPSIDGARLAAEHDLVVVTFNHRLNALGYMQVVDPTAEPGSPYAVSGNVGQLDIVAALEWVRDNIAAFGGDPGSVTLAGQSGGAMKISLLLAMPAAQPLFHRAILQSGTAVRALAPAEALAAAGRLRAAAGLADDAGPEALAGLALADLMRAYKAVATGMTDFGPVVDGLVVPHQPFSAASVALSGDKPLIMGDMDTEAALFLSGRREALEALGREGVVARLARAVGEDTADRLVGAIEAHRPGIGPYELAVQVVSDGIFAGPTRAGAEARATGAHAPTWRYRNLLRTAAMDGALMSPHELDVALAFGNIEAAAGLNGGTPETHEVSRVLRATWAAFARSGDPANATIPTWPAYDGERKVLLISPTPRVADGDVDGAALAVAGGLSDRMIDWFGVFS